MSKKSPTQLSLDFLNKSGYTCAIIERWNSFAGIRQDVFGFADILAYGRHGIALIQTTTQNNYEARKKKVLASPHFEGWKKAGGVVLLHGWGKDGLRGEQL